MVSPTQTVGVPTIDHSPRRLVLYKHVRVPDAELGATFDRVFGELYGAINRSGVAPAGPPFATYHAQSEPGVLWDMDICAPIATPLAPPPGLEVRDMPAERIVTYLHRGPYETLDETYRLLDQYIADNGLNMTGGPREIYLSEPDVAPAEVLTQVEYPIA